VLAFTMLDTVEAGMLDFVKEAVVNYGSPNHTHTSAGLDTLQKEVQRVIFSKAHIGV
jgi:hypothetical protein